jgi:hypothetical protein
MHMRHTDLELRGQWIVNRPFKPLYHVHYSIIVFLPRSILDLFEITLLGIEARPRPIVQVFCRTQST